MDNWLCKTVCPENKRTNINNSKDSPHKGPVMQKASSCHDMIMHPWILTRSLLTHACDAYVIKERNVKNKRVAILELFIYIINIMTTIWGIKFCFDFAA